MESNFVRTINYLKELNDSLDNENLSNEDRIIAIIQYALLNDNYHQGSIILTNENGKYKVSSIQKHTYAWLLKDRSIDIDYVINKLTELDIRYSLEHYPISDHKDDYELSFSITKLKKRTRVIN